MEELISQRLTGSADPRSVSKTDWAHVLSGHVLEVMIIAGETFEDLGGKIYPRYREDGHHRTRTGLSVAR